MAVVSSRSFSLREKADRNNLLLGVATQWDFREAIPLDQAIACFVGAFADGLLDLALAGLREAPPELRIATAARL